MKILNNKYPYLLFLLMFITTHAFGKDSIQVEIRVLDTAKAPILLFYQEGEESKTSAGKEIAFNHYLFNLPNHGYLPFKLMANSEKNMLISKSGFTPKPTPSLLAAPNEVLQISINHGDQLDLTIDSKDKEVIAFEVYGKKERAYLQKSWDLLKQSKQADSTEHVAIQTQMKALNREFEPNKEEFVRNNKTSFAALVVFSGYFMTLPPIEANKTLAQLAPKYKNTALWQSLNNKLNAALKSGLGEKIPQFEEVDLAGNTFNSGNLDGKYYLIDFWGSWCVPCRQSHPELKEIYEKYHEKGLEILGIAFESGKPELQEENWKKAIAEDQINWRHILNSPKNNLVKLFGVTSYPTKILVDPQGKILYRTGSDNRNIQDVIKEIFN